MKLITESHHIALIHAGLTLLMQYSEKSKALYDNQTDDFTEWMGTEAKALQADIRQQVTDEDLNLLAVFNKNQSPIL